MARTTKQLSGGGKDGFLRALIGEVALPDDKATQLGDTLCAEIREVRVVRETWEALRHKPLQPRATAKPSPPAGNLTSPAREPAAVLETPAFDPFVFSALAILTKQGAAALTKRLAEIESLDDLRALAKAQHLAVDAGLADADALRAAMLRATEARLAERRAAAS